MWVRPDSSLVDTLDIVKMIVPLFHTAGITSELTVHGVNVGWLKRPLSFVAVIFLTLQWWCVHDTISIDIEGKIGAGGMLSRVRVCSPHKPWWRQRADCLRHVMILPAASIPIENRETYRMSYLHWLWQVRRGLTPRNGCLQLESPGGDIDSSCNNNRLMNFWT